MPPRSVGVLNNPQSWVRRNLFNGAGNTILSLALIALLLWVIPPLVNWAIVKATITPDPAICREAGGACWGFVTQKYRLILFGIYPYEEQWRPTLAVILFIAATLVSAYPSNWGKRWLIALWLVVIPACAILMWGGVLGLPYVSNERWGGLPLTLILSAVGIGVSFPLAVLLALGRRSHMPAVRAWCVIYIELWRGVPLVSVLFMASIMFPLFLPEGVTIDKLLRAQIGIILFTAAYLAEIIRGGLQAIPKGQYEAADALGFSYWRKTHLIIMPQAIRLVIPPLVGQFITTFKDTSLVIIIGLYDLLSTTKVALAAPEWRSFFIEGYLVAALVYFAFTFFMSRYSLFLERHLSAEQRR